MCLLPGSRLMAKPRMARWPELTILMQAIHRSGELLRARQVLLYGLPRVVLVRLLVSGPRMYDAVVVGARCAGASLAMLLARRGYRVALVDRARFPSDTMSTHFLWQRGGARLEAWGLLGRLRDRGCEPIRTVTYDVGPVALRGLGPPVGGVSD